MSEQTGKTLKDHLPTPSKVEGGDLFPPAAPRRAQAQHERYQGPFEQRGTSQSDKTPEIFTNPDFAGSIHPWKGYPLTVPSEVPGEEEFQGVRVRGGTVFSQVRNLEQEFDVPEQTFYLDEGFIYLLIERDPDSWEVITDGVTMTFADIIPESFDIQQYYPLIQIVKTETPVDPEDSTSDVITTREVVQLQFEEIRIRQELTIDNGELQLAGYQMSHRNTYNLPT